MAASLSATISTSQLQKTKSFQLGQHLVEKRNITMSLSRRYEQLLRSEKYYDCIFHIGGINVKCHKLILSAASPVFEAMFFGPIHEKQLQIEILDISPEIFNVLMCYIYAGVVDFEQLNLEETVELYYSAEKYLLSDLIDDCLLAITRKLRFSNILPALELCVCMDLNALLQVCMSFFTRCCLGDPQYMAYHKLNYLHITKECIKVIISSNKEVRKHLLWFVYEWCQQECNELGLQKSDCALIIDDLQLKENGMECADLLNAKTQQLQQQHCYSIERSYYKACRPFTIDYADHEWKLFVKCDRFISLRGIVMHSRLTPNLTSIATLSHFAHALTFPSEYNENIRIEISAATMPAAAAVGRSNSNSDGEDESDHEVAPAAMDQDRQQEQNVAMIWQHTVAKQPTKFNCDLNINWEEGVILSPEIEYQIKLIWQQSAFGSEYPCSLLSNSVDGVQFRDFNAHCGSLVKGLRFLNLV